MLGTTIPQALGRGAVGRSCELLLSKVAEIRNLTEKYAFLNRIFAVGIGEAGESPQIVKRQAKTKQEI